MTVKGLILIHCNNCGKDFAVKKEEAKKHLTEEDHLTYPYYWFGDSLTYTLQKNSN